MRLFRISTWILWAKNIILLFIIALAFYSTIPIKTSQTVLVPKGSITYIIAQLQKKGYGLNIIDKYLLILMGKPQSGWVHIGQKSLNRIDFLHKLTTAKARIEIITLIPGETKVLFLEALAKQLSLDEKQLHEYYNKFSDYEEAGIYADTYYVPEGIKEKHLMNFLIRESKKKYNKISQKFYGDYETRQWRKILIIASIIQKEAANNKEMPIIASVIYNRLKKNMRLQMDGTLNYGKYSHIRVTPQRLRTDMSHFNTYKHRGLPKTPIGAVSFHAIKSALSPAKTKYLYFMKNRQGVHDFTDTFKKHRSNIIKAK